MLERPTGLALGGGGENQQPLSRAELRKYAKPLMEKKRRARINASLTELKSLVLDAMYRRDSARYSKLEKADVLDMAVKHLKLQHERQITAAIAIDPTVADKYNAGYIECAREVCSYLRNMDGLSTDVRMRLLNHMANCIQNRKIRPSSRPSPNYNGHSNTSQIHLIIPTMASVQALPIYASFTAEQAHKNTGSSPIKPSGSDILIQPLVSNSSLTVSADETHLQTPCSMESSPDREVNVFNSQQFPSKSTGNAGHTKVEKIRPQSIGGVYNAPVWRPW